LPAYRNYALFLIRTGTEYHKGRSAKRDRRFTTEERLSVVKTIAEARSQSVTARDGE